MAENEKLAKEQMDELEKSMNLKWTKRFYTMLDAMQDRFGPEIIEVYGDMIEKEVKHEWSEISKNQESHEIEDFIRLLWEPLREQGFEFTSEKTPEGLQMKCTKCPMVDFADLVGNREWSFHSFCCTDPHMVEGFNSKIGFRRTKTLMEGHDCCDHFYYMKK